VKRSSWALTASITLGWRCPVLTHGNAGGKVDVAVSLDIPDLRIFRAFGVDLRHHADAPRDGICLAALDGSVLTHFSNFLRYLHVRLVKRGQMRTRTDQFGQIVCL
jgi:hypothetical protein